MAPGVTGKLLAACALWAGVTVLAVREWQAAAPKLFGVLLGLALVNAIAAEPLSVRRIRVFWLGLAIAATGLIALSALFLTEWPQRKLLPLDNLYLALPAGPRVVDHGGRTGGIGPNQIGGALALLTPLGLALTLDRFGSGRRVRALAAVVLVLALGVLLVTQSRSAYVGALVGMALVGWWRLRQCTWPLSRRRVAEVALAVALAGLLAATVFTWLAPLDSTTDTLTGRIEIWTASVILIGNHLYTGVGPGQFPLAMDRSFPELGASVAPHIPHAHNFVLQALLDLGLPGTVFLSFVIAAAVRGLIATMRRAADRSLQLLAVGLTGSLLAFFVYGLTDTIAPGARGGLPFWLVLGLALACGRLPQRGRTAQ
ncbi:MAG: O-antigen ligase family protein [Chloroflexota bacterium]|nr:O-antigen ligase family protein [Chloroflexota bacterium]